ERIGNVGGGGEENAVNKEVMGFPQMTTDTAKAAIAKKNPSRFLIGRLHLTIASQPYRELALNRLNG
ncbi:MAG: hypothetical protein WBC73_14020, partial [Phormidesmis sp.]